MEKYPIQFNSFALLLSVDYKNVSILVVYCTQYHKVNSNDKIILVQLNVILIIIAYCTVYLLPLHFSDSTYWLQNDIHFLASLLV